MLDLTVYSCMWTCGFSCVVRLSHSLLLNITDVIPSFIGIKKLDLEIFCGFIHEKRMAHFCTHTFPASQSVFSLWRQLKNIKSSLLNEAETDFPGWLPRWPRAVLHCWAGRHTQELCLTCDPVIEVEATDVELTSGVATRWILTCTRTKRLKIKVAHLFAWSLAEKKNACKGRKAQSICFSLFVVNVQVGDYPCWERPSWGCGGLEGRRRKSVSILRTRHIVPVDIDMNKHAYRHKQLLS